MAKSVARSTRRESSRAFRDRALVIRHHDFGESHRIIVLLTRENGLIRAVAKGVRKTKSRFGGRLAPFFVLDVGIHIGRGSLATLTGADSVEAFNQKIVSDYGKYTSACTILDIAEKLALGEPTSALFDLCVEAISDIADGYSIVGQSAREFPGAALALRVDKFVLQAARLSGWAPILFECASCGAPGPHHAFSAAAGGAVCGACRPPGAMNVPEGSLRLAWWLLNDREPQVGRAFGDMDAVRRCHDLVFEHVQWHVGAKIRAADLMES